jgi:hypothetical protein
MQETICSDHVHDCGRSTGHVVPDIRLCCALTTGTSVLEQDAPLMSLISIYALVQFLSLSLNLSWGRDV